MNALTDFTDWLSPMLVKELRQGVRARVFVNALLFLQGSLVLMTIVGLLASSAQQDTVDFGPALWVLAGAFLLLFLPLSGLGAISRERTSNTLELIFLTRLSARRIVAGKWLAIVAQTTLLVFTILPYILLRYFLGGVDLWGELIGVCALLLSSAMLSAITVGISPFPTMVSRILVVIGLIIGLNVLVGTLAMMGMGVGGRGPLSILASWKDGFSAMLQGTFVALFMLEFGAAQIAPPAENHSSSLRLLGLGGVAAGIFLDHLVFRVGSARALTAFCFATPILISALCESPRAIANIYRPFVRRGFFGRAAGRFLYPGWQSAVPYALLMVSTLGLELLFEGVPQRRANAVLLVIIATGALLFPAAVIRAFGKRLRYSVAVYLYLGIQGISMLLYFFASLLEDFMRQDFHPILNVIPPCAWLSLMFGRIQDPLTELPVVGGATAVVVIVLLWQSRRPWRQISSLEKKPELMRDEQRVLSAPEATVSPVG